MWATSNANNVFEASLRAVPSRGLSRRLSKQPQGEISRKLTRKPWKYWLRLLSLAWPTLELRHLDFRELCAAKYPGRKLHSLEIVEQLDLIRESLTSKH